MSVISVAACCVAIGGESGDTILILEFPTWC